MSKRITAQRGEDCIISKLDNEKVRLIRENAILRAVLRNELKKYPIKTRKTNEYLEKKLTLQKLTNKHMANSFNVSIKAIEAVTGYKTWSHI